MAKNKLDKLLAQDEPEADTSQVENIGSEMHESRSNYRSHTLHCLMSGEGTLSHMHATTQVGVEVGEPVPVEQATGLVMPATVVSVEVLPDIQVVEIDDPEHGQVWMQS